MIEISFYDAEGVRNKWLRGLSKNNVEIEVRNIEGSNLNELHFVEANITYIFDLGGSIQINVI